MIALAAFYFGWAMGARGGAKSVDDVSAALTSQRESEEFASLVSALRAHLGFKLHQAADWFRATDGPPLVVPDVLARVQELVFPVNGAGTAERPERRRAS